MSMLELGDLDFIKDSIEEVEEWTSEFITIFTITATSGVPSSLEPIDITTGSTEIKATVRRISAREINESGGIYKQDDLMIHSSGSINSNSDVVYRTGTYCMIDKMSPILVDYEDVRWRGVLRRGQL